MNDRDLSNHLVDVVLGITMPMIISVIIAVVVLVGLVRLVMCRFVVIGLVVGLLNQHAVVDRLVIAVWNVIQTLSFSADLVLSNTANVVWATLMRSTSVSLFGKKVTAEHHLYLVVVLTIDFTYIISH